MHFILSIITFKEFVFEQKFKNFAMFITNGILFIKMLLTSTIKVWCKIILISHHCQLPQVQFYELF